MSKLEPRSEIELRISIVVVQVEVAFPRPGALSNFPFHFSSCLKSVTASKALGVPWSGSAPPSSKAYSFVSSRSRE